MWVGGGMVGKNISKKASMVKNGRNSFRKMKKVQIEIYNIHIQFQSA